MPELSYEAIADGLNVCTSQWHRFGTDAVLLAEFSAYRRKERVCDLGTGCGIIPMLMQRKDAPQEVYGVDVSDDALRKAVAEHNEVCKIITEIGDMRKLENPPITGYEFHVLNLVTYCCPKSKILPYLKETLAEIKKRKVDAKPWYRCRVALIGSEIDDLDMTRMVEDAGAMIVADRFCFGSTPGREVIELNDEEDVLRQICRHYMETSECARYISDEKVHQRRETADRLAREYKADGIIVASNKFCEYWSYERVIDTVVLQRDFGYPVCSIEKEYINAASGQLRTRFQAFIESVEIKKIQEGVKR